MSYWRSGNDAHAPVSQRTRFINMNRMNCLCLCVVLVVKLQSFMHLAQVVKVIRSCESAVCCWLRASADERLTPAVTHSVSANHRRLVTAHQQSPRCHTAGSAAVTLWDISADGQMDMESVRLGQSHDQRTTRWWCHWLTHSWDSCCDLIGWRKSCLSFNS